MKPIQSPKRRQALQAMALITTATLLPVTAHAREGGVWLVVTHKVEDFAHWKPVFDSIAALKRGYGWRQSSVFIIDGDHNHVMVMEEFDNLEHAKAFASSPDLKAAMSKAGVVGPPEIRFVEKVLHSKA